MEKSNEIYAVVCPKQKIIKIQSGKRKKPTILKRYKFKTEIPFKEETKIVNKYDYSAWSVSERDYTVEVKQKVYDMNVIKELEKKAIEYYLSHLKTSL